VARTVIKAQNFAPKKKVAIKDSKLTLYSAKAMYEAALQPFPRFALVWCSTWLGITRQRQACCS
jgi:hypothetical protein